MEIDGKVQRYYHSLVILYNLNNDSEINFKIKKYT